MLLSEYSPQPHHVRNSVTGWVDQPDTGQSDHEPGLEAE